MFDINWLFTEENLHYIYIYIYRLPMTCIASINQNEYRHWCIFYIFWPCDQYIIIINTHKNAWYSHRLLLFFVFLYSNHVSFLLLLMVSHHSYLYLLTQITLNTTVGGYLFTIKRSKQWIKWIKSNNGKQWIKRTKCNNR